MTGYEALRQAAGLVDRSPAGAVAVRGPEARDFLQSLVSQDVATLADGQGAHSLLLHPTGKLDVDFRVLRVGDEFWLDTEPGWGERLASSLRRFLIRVQAEVEDRGDEWGLVTVRGPEAVRLVEGATGVGVPTVAHGHTAWGGVRVVRADWPGLRGVDLLGPAAAVAGAVPRLVDHGIVPATEDDWETVRVECGVPRLGVDLDESVIPQEAFLDEVAVSFDKGCFLGQELVCRIRDRGHVNRHLRRLRMVDGGLPPVGAEVVAGETPEGERTVGSVTSAVESPSLAAVVALAYVRRDVEPGAEVGVRWEVGDARAVVEEVLLAG